VTTFGAVFSIALNVAMVEAFVLEPLAWYVIPTVMFALMVVGQLSVAGPVRRECNTTPAIAARSI
jgi:hypothetical protein